jgi:hypothetical protein
MAEVMSLKDKLAMFNKKIDKQSEGAQFEQQFKAKVVTFFLAHERSSCIVHTFPNFISVLEKVKMKGAKKTILRLPKTQKAEKTKKTSLQLQKKLGKK